MTDQLGAHRNAVIACRRYPMEFLFDLRHQATDGQISDLLIELADAPTGHPQALGRVLHGLLKQLANFLHRALNHC